MFLQDVSAASTDPKRFPELLRRAHAHRARGMPADLICTSLLRDVNEDPLLLGLTAEDAARAAAAVSEIGEMEAYHRATAGWHPRQAVLYEELIATEYPDPVLYMDPLIRDMSLNMIYGQRGGGKSWVGHLLLLGIAAGGELFNGKWKAIQARNCLIVDGELPPRDLKTRLCALVQGTGLDPCRKLSILSPFHESQGLPSLGTAAGRSIVEEQATDADVILFDNISCLAPGLVENEGQAWGDLIQWTTGLRSRGKAIIMVAHAGKVKERGPRGHSRQEDPLDLSLSVEKVAGEGVPDGSSRFRLTGQKTRHLAEVQALDLTLTTEDRDGKLYRADFAAVESREALRELAMEMLSNGVSAGEVARELNLPSGTVRRWKTEGR